MANQVTLVNDSKGHRPISVVYKVAHKNPGSPTVLSRPHVLRLNQSISIPLGLDGFRLAGIVPVSIDGHKLPEGVNGFDKPRQCSMTTDKRHPAGSLAFAFTASSYGQFKLTCKTEGGIFG